MRFSCDATLIYAIMNLTSCALNHSLGVCYNNITDSMFSALINKLLPCNVFCLGRVIVDGNLTFASQNIQRRQNNLLVFTILSICRVRVAFLPDGPRVLTAAPGVTWAPGLNSLFRVTRQE